jgi:hypothetical protein
MVPLAHISSKRSLKFSRAWCIESSFFETGGGLPKIPELSCAPWQESAPDDEAPLKFREKAKKDIAFV